MEGKLRRGMIRMAVYATIGILPSPPLLVINNHLVGKSKLV